jgi:hypothetical protein
MSARFPAAFRLTPPDQPSGPVWRDGRLTRAAGYLDLAERYAGRTFDDGLYRLHDADGGPRALALVEAAFPELAGRVCPFGSDWYGRQVAVDAGRVEAGQPLLIILDVADGEAVEVPYPFAAFHDEILVQHPDEILARDRFRRWSAANPAALPLRPDQCVAPRVPYFLGGSDALEDLELIDLEVHWSLCGQLRLGTRGLADGTPITGTAIQD